MSRLAYYRKAVVALLGSGLTWATAVLPPDSRGWQIASAALGLLTAVGVLATENAKPPRPAGGLNLGPARRSPLQ
jgi:hypothetical protein